MNENWEVNAQYGFQLNLREEYDDEKEEKELK